MASHSAIALVTEVLRRRLTETIRSEFPGVQVLAKPPEVNDGHSQGQVSLHLYRVSEASQLPNRRTLPARGTGGGPAAALDLHYLLSFTGEEHDLVPQRLLALAIASLNSSPVLSSAEIEAASIESWLAHSGLNDEVGQVRLSMSSMSLEELSTIWSAFVQVPLQLSVGFTAGVVLIDPHPATPEPPPALAREGDEPPTSAPAIEQRVVREKWLDDIQVPDDQKRMLVQIRDQVLLRAAVYDDYGFRPRLAGSLGVTALFTGASGTGKTMAAEALAHELHLDLHRIDLAGVVSKYIGETEKNLRRVFDSAEQGGAVLLFDEADALFGRRGGVRDSHHRYANLEANYLLRRMEAYSGLTILTANMRDALDSAFVRRMRFVVTFPFPGPEQRRNIWRGVFPRVRVDGSASDLQGLDALDFEALASHPLTGGQIRSIAVNSAFLAAAGDGAITMDLLQAAARDELRKMGLPNAASDSSAWRTPGSEA
jgi:hypothetical protein